MEAQRKTDSNTDNLVQYLKGIHRAGFEDVHTLRRDTAEEILTEARNELIEEIATGNVESVRDLARRTDRNVSIVSRDVKKLVEAGIVEYEHNGSKKRPVLAHKNIFVKPVVFKGSMLADDDLENS
ncbi:HVO_A0114 family putative DNA-binding protein [Halorussus ruber]|uniref:HVO_A0114 family putative DNA-binding protein n=1 Tax=Halorussus ruber TaxID=1126238 RepID=UPI001092DE45|nr:ArsR family transcriptional regulator [Halorussus ruber]